ncbi:MAG TPA: glycosyltransferase family 4 protein, partial [Chloroflexota bacterium]|nr:glycosyltransferase family 4 protein [Chloroflexota bacterium]
MPKRTSRNPRVAVVRHGVYGQPHPRRDIFALRDAGFDVDFICDSEPGKPHIEHIDGVTVIRMPLRHKRGRLGRYIFEYTVAPVLAGAILALRSVGKRYDYVEIDTMPTWLIAAAAVPKLLGSTVVLYMFEHMAELHATDTGLSERHWRIRLLDAIEMACVRAADTVLTPAERNRELYISRGIATEKIIFIPNCPDERLFLAGAGNRDEIRSRRTKTEFRLVTHGTLLERYGIQLLLAAVVRLRERIPGLRLEVIGSGEYESALKTESRRLEIQDLVEFTGPVPFERVAARLLQSDLGVGPYLLDLLPNKMMEYFLLGIPAVASDWPTMRRYFGDDVVRYVRPNDLEDLTEAVYDLYRDPVKRAKQATAAREHFQNTLAWSRTKQDYLAVYDAAE